MLLHKKKILNLIFLTLISVILFLTLFIDIKHFDYAFALRFPKVIVMLITAFCIGSASIVFQSIINNVVVTPCLLGMNALYILVNTSLIFVLGSTHFVVRNKVLSFSLDLIIMTLVSILVYGYLFKKAKGNILYVLLSGTVMATLFSSITSTLQRIIDPNEFAVLQNTLIASFHKASFEIIVFSIFLIVIIIFVLRKDLENLDVITLGKAQAVNLGVDYDKSVQRLLVGVTLFIAIATALVGPISFLGLIIANLSRQFLKTYRHIDIYI